MNPNVRWMAVSGFVALGAICCNYTKPAVWEVEESDLALPATAKSMEITTHNGSITVSGDPGADEIKVHVVKRAGGADLEDARACLAAIQLDTAVQDGAARLTWSWSPSRKIGWQEEVSFEVVLPPNIPVLTTSHNGKMKLSGMQANVVARTHNGPLTIAGHEGDVDGQTHNGRIEFKGAVSQISLVTHNGSIEADLTGSAEVAGRIATHNGSIALTLGDSLSAELDCQTHNGRVEAASWLEKRIGEKTRFVGKAGQGGKDLAIETHNGSIDVK